MTATMGSRNKATDTDNDTVVYWYDENGRLERRDGASSELLSVALTPNEHGALFSPICDTDGTVRGIAVRRS